MTAPTDLVCRLVDQVMNGGDLERLNELCSPQLAPKLRAAFTQFRDAFPTGTKRSSKPSTTNEPPSPRMRCTGTHYGTWQGLAPTGRVMRIDEVYFFRPDTECITGLWGLEDIWTRMRQLAGDVLPPAQ